MEAFDNYIKTKKLDVSISAFIRDKKVEPKIFIDYVNQAKEKYKRQQAALENLNLAIKVGGILIVIMASAFGVAIYLRTY